MQNMGDEIEATRRSSALGERNIVRSQNTSQPERLHESQPVGWTSETGKRLSLVVREGVEDLLGFCSRLSRSVCELYGKKLLVKSTVLCMKSHRYVTRCKKVGSPCSHRPPRGSL